MTNQATAKFEVFRYVNDEFKWRLRAPNGDILAESSRTFKQHKRAVKDIPIVKEVMGSACQIETTLEG